jgi:hypothetical protein
MWSKSDEVTDATLRVERIKERISRAEYRVDADALAEAIVRRLFIIGSRSGAGNPAGPARGHAA